MFISTFQHLIVAFSLTTLTSNILHGTHLDTAFTTLSSVSFSHVSFHDDAHTHTEKINFDSRQMERSDARITPRETKHKKYLLQKHAGRGQHAFDGYYLPLA